MKTKASMLHYGSSVFGTPHTAPLRCGATSCRCGNSTQNTSNQI